MRGWALLGVGLAAGVVVLAIVGVVGGLPLADGSSDDQTQPTIRSAPRDEAPSTTTTAPSTDATDRRPGAGGESSALGPRVTLVAAEDGSGPFLPLPSVVGGLAPDTVLQVSVVGFGSFSSAVVRQCVTGTTRSCGNTVPVQFTEDGAARFQYLVTTRFAPAAAAGDCRVQGARCSIVVEETDGDHRAEIITVFRDEVPPPGRLRVTPGTGLDDGQEVVLNVTGLRPGAEVTALMCAAKGGDGSPSCEPLGPDGTMTVRPDGQATSTVNVVTQNVGPEDLDCDRDRSCAVVVVSDSSLVRAPAVRIGLATPPGAAYDIGRVAPGIALAFLLLAIATYLVRRTDWSPIGEAAAPEIDDAEYADLDAIVAALPPDPEFDEAMAGSRRR